MFKSTYRALFEVVVENTYYANHVGTDGGDEADFDWLPTPDTVQVFKRYGLLFRKTRSGFTVLANVRKNAADLLTTQVPNGTKLLFVMNVLNASIPAITDLPTNTDARLPLFYFTNLQVHTEAEVNRKNLPITKTLVVEPADQLQTAEQRATLLNRLGSLAEGPVFGVVDIVVDGAQPAMYRIMEPTRVLTDERPVFKIPFQNRKSRWRYDVNISTSSIEVDALVTQHLPSFSRQNLSNKRIRFVGDAETELLEKPNPVPDVKLTYRVGVSAGVPLSGQPIERVLPHPMPSALSAETDPVTQITTIYSNVFITI